MKVFRLWLIYTWGTILTIIVIFKQDSFPILMIWLVLQTIIFKTFENPIMNWLDKYNSS